MSTAPSKHLSVLINPLKPSDQGWMWNSKTSFSSFQCLYIIKINLQLNYVIENEDVKT
jgi:hypothetical protein